MRSLGTLALALLALAACDSSEESYDHAGRYVAVVLDLERAGDGRYNALASGGGLALTLTDDGRVTGTFNPGRDDSNGADAPTPSTAPFSGTYARFGIREMVIDSDDMDPRLPSLFNPSGEDTYEAEVVGFTGGYRIVLERQ